MKGGTGEGNNRHEAIRRAKQEKRFRDLLVEIASKRGGHKAIEEAAVLLSEIHGQWIGEWDALGSLYVRVPREVEAAPKADDSASIAGRIADWYATFPHAYSIYFPLSDFPELGAEPVQIGPRAELVVAEYGNAKRGVTVSDNALTAGIGRLLPGKRYMRISCQGYAEFGNEDESAVATAIRLAKCVLVLGETEGCLKFDLGYTESMPTTAAIVDVTDGVALPDIALPNAFARSLANVSLTESAHPLPNTLSGLAALGNPERMPEHRAVQLTSRMSSIAQVLIAAEHEDKSANSILNAAEWAFDSIVGSLNAVAYIQICVAFEAAYGGDQSASVAELLASKVAFSLAQSHTHRDELRRKFKTFYEKRSNITHGRTTRLSTEETKLLVWGQVQLRNVLEHELRLIRAQTTDIRE